MNEAPESAVQRRQHFDERFAANLRGFGLVGIIAIVIIFSGNLVVAPLSALFVLLWVWLSRTPWREIGYVRPKSWIGGLAIGVVFGAAFKLVMKVVVMPLLVADPINHAYHNLVGNAAALPFMIFVMVFVAGFGEETFFRGYLFERAGKLIGQSAAAKAATVIATALFFGSLHYFDQGIGGVEQAIITGSVFGTIFAITGRIWMLMCAHAAFDIMAVAIIYLNIETEVAHFVYK